MQRLLASIRGACPKGLWSQGVKFVREAAVRTESSDADEVVLRVRVPGRGVAPTVVLYPGDNEWECDCPSSARACEHVAAAVIALTQPASEHPTGATPSKTATLVYKLTSNPGSLGITRVLHTSDETEVPLPRLTQKACEQYGLDATKQDWAVDRLLAHHGGEVNTLPLRLVPVVFRDLEDRAQVTFDGEPVKPSPEPVLPLARLDDVDDKVRLTVRPNPVVTGIAAPGVAICGTVLRPLAEPDFTGTRLEKLPIVREFSQGELGELTTRLLPKLRAHIELDNQSARLPGRTRREKPRLDFQVSHEKHRLTVLPLLVYGTPPIARVDGGKLVHLGGTAVPVRDEHAERVLLHQLRDELNLVPGRRVSYEGDDAARLATQLRRWGQSADGLGVDHPPLVPSISIRNAQLSISFASDDKKAASAQAVLAAWQSGHDYVALLGGGWAPIPTQWLEEHGHLVAELLESRDASGRIPPLALPLLGELTEKLEQPPPLELERLAPLFADFERIPPAKLPADLEATLRPYQRVGINWASFLREQGLGALLADDMGLGKTLQALAVIRGQTLVVCPTSVLHNWETEATRFRPKLRVCRYHGPSRKLDPEADLTLTTYALLRLDIEVLAHKNWDAVILDEAQAIKNPDSQVAQAAYSLDAKFRMALTGTPIENRLEELWSQFHFVGRGLLGGRKSFQDRYAKKIADGDNAALAQLRRRIKPFLLRRKKAEVAPDLPTRTESVLYCTLSEPERAKYDAIRAATVPGIIKQLRQGGGVMAALESLLRLRQAACHPGLLPGQDSDQDSSKLSLLIESLGQTVAEGHKALLFSQWTSFLDLVEPELDAAGIAYTRLDGGTRDRGAVVDRFQADDGPPVMLLSLKAGGTGLNLTAADHVYILDLWWNPQAEDQAADRAHRIGQHRPVMIYRLVAEQTVEERILDLQQRKRAIAEAALEGTAEAGAITRADLLALLE